MSLERTLILASTSPYRRALLERLGLSFECQGPVCDESLRPELSPMDFVKSLAREKALSVKRPKALVIGSDQIVEIDGQILGKPGDAQGAKRQLQRLAGRSHRLITAVAVVDTVTQELREAVDIHVLHMHDLSADEIETYVKADEPYFCAGSYMLEKRGIALFKKIEADPETADDTAIIGLPLTKTLNLLRGFGFNPLNQVP